MGCIQRGIGFVKNYGCQYNRRLTCKHQSTKYGLTPLFRVQLLHLERGQDPGVQSERLKVTLWSFLVTKLAVFLSVAPWSAAVYHPKGHSEAEVCVQTIRGLTGPPSTGVKIKKI